ncbi:AAA family ATPase [Colidextribacter sp. OB.20]|uniref:ATP-binding protein n=1 Tax=Colidextribacter sp. OB.20 TaxID=2304568 RepID=UPI00136F32A2|nr:AAA family ATPase [Colidextribacter sp. OB.20]NBI09973.1 AAA family ATPase [Colidextribacter sp. OB.20]
MKTAQAAAPSAPVPAPQVCRPIHIHSLPGVPGNLLRYTPLFREVPRRTLRSELRDAPQFQSLRLRSLLKNTRGSLRVLLLGEDSYCTAQAAVYLASLSHSREKLPPGWESDDWGGVDFCDLDEPEEPVSPDILLSRSLAVVSPEALDPALGQNKSHSPVAAIPGEAERPVLSLRALAAPAVLITAGDGRVLTPAVLEQVKSLDLRNEDMPLDILIALKSSQLDSELLEELRFTCGFQAARVGRPDQAYYRRFLRQCGEDQRRPIDRLADLDRVISHTRRLRGDRFCELDLESLISWAVQRRVQPPLRTRDLLFPPFQIQGDSWKELERMTGLEEVKEKLRRLLARAVWEKRRGQAGKPVRPMCRNLAFAGPPGTGKSVTARLAARILREKGCGSGRFVEAGREQLIGTYLGETSPRIAELFEQARGGVLFIDEAGALLGGEYDIYAAEAVNALVRHMELQPETMVIFATYPGEMERLLSSNPGLKSRIAQILNFPAYDDDQLWAILQGFAREDGCALPEGTGEVCRGFFSALRRRDPEGFGNGREARRLFQGAAEELALRALDTGEETLRLEDLNAAAERLLAGTGGAERRPIGFR